MYNEADQTLKYEHLSTFQTVPKPNTHGTYTHLLWIVEAIIDYQYYSNVSLWNSKNDLF